MCKNIAYYQMPVGPSAVGIIRAFEKSEDMASKFSCCHALITWSPHLSSLHSFFSLCFKYLLSSIFKFHKTKSRKQILSFVPGKADELTGSTERSFSDTHTVGNVRSQ